MTRLKHGLAHTPEYRAWQTMRHRCTSPNSPAWDDYGGRGITMCAEWLNDPAAFMTHVGKRPSPRHEIDRKDNDRGYEPGNVRWVIRKVNDRNRRSNRPVTHGDVTKTIAEWSEITGIRPDTLAYRLKIGWSPGKALTTPTIQRVPNGQGWRAKKRIRDAARSR